MNTDIIKAWANEIGLEEERISQESLNLLAVGLALYWHLFCVSLEQKTNTCGIARRVIKLQSRFFVYLCRRFDSADFVYSFIYLLYYTSMWPETREWVQAGIRNKQFWERQKLLQPLPLRVPGHWARRHGAANSLISADSFASWDAHFFLKRVWLLLSMCLCPIPASGHKRSEQVPTTPQCLPITSLYT